MLLRKALHHLVQLSADGGGGGDLYLAAKAAHPAKNCGLTQMGTSKWK